MHHRRLLLTMRYLSVHCQLWGACREPGVRRLHQCSPWRHILLRGTGHLLPEYMSHPALRGLWQRLLQRWLRQDLGREPDSVYQFIGAACI